MAIEFRKFAKAVARACGNAKTFALACAVIFLWLISGPIFDYSDTWQLIINTGTTIVTFLMVFVIQNTQNRDSAALQVKLDELIRATEGAHNALLDLEELKSEELEMIQHKYAKLAEKARNELREGKQDTDKPEVDRGE